MSARDPIADFLARQEVMILDGGLATELEERGHRLDTDLWSAAHLMDGREALESVHRAYLSAGADCIATATYQATLPGLEAAGLSRPAAIRSIRAGVEVAIGARDAFWAETSNERQRPLVAVSVGPYGAYLADGSEFTGDYDLDETGLFEFHRERWDLLASAGADLVVCETVPSAVEARVLVRLFLETPAVHGWLSFSCRDGRHISDGTELARAVAEIGEVPNVSAVGVNCTAPRYVASLLRSVRAETALPLVAYPNSGEVWDGAGRRWLDGSADPPLADLAREWVECGARLVGGCCRTGPASIAALRRALVS